MMIGGKYVLVAGLLGFASFAQAGAYIGAGEGWGVDLITHPSGYNFSGTANLLEINVCIVPGSPNATAMEQSVRNIIAVYNQLLPTTGNLRPGHLLGSQFDFESVAVHEVGHCLGQAHVNLASESGLTEPDRNYTKSTDGGTPNNFDIAPGTDGIRGSSDDLRGDDVNLHWYRAANNNPFTIDYSTVDSTTYARDTDPVTGSLPIDHLFATNGDRTVASSLLSTPNTEAVMQQLTFGGEIQRTLTHDGVATLQYGMSGLDESAGSSDDYTFHLNFATSNCDINLSFDNAETGFAVCQAGFSLIPDQSAIITSADIFFNTGFNWVFNTIAPCTETLTLTQNKWTMFTLPCSVGISTGNTLADVLGDDMSGVYDTNWVVYERDSATDVYTKLTATSEMFTGKGYWVFTNQTSQSFDVEGQFNGSPDTLLHGAVGGRDNLVGHPFDFSVDWSDVQIVDGADVQSLAAAVADGDLSETFHIWNGNAYQASDASTIGMIGTLTKFDGIWVNAIKDGIYLRVPSIESSAASSATTSLAVESASAISTASQFDNKTVANEVADDGSWAVRIIVESGDFKDSGNVLGQLPDSLDGQDKHDLEELAPFGGSYLTVIFPHEEWAADGDAEVWGYTSDFHASSRKPRGEWTFAVMSSIDVSEVSLRLEGPEGILRKAKLRDMETGKLVRFSKGIYTFNASPGIRYFTFRIGGT